MYTLIMIVGSALLIWCFLAALKHGGLAGQQLNKKEIGLFLCFIVGFLLLGFGMHLEDQNNFFGKPKTSIKNGSYIVLGYVDVLQDKQSYYQLILEQDGEVKLYALPKDMIDTAPSGVKMGTLEVVEKSGLRKAILYVPIPGGVNPFP